MIFKRFQQNDKMLSAILIAAILLFSSLAKSSHLAEHDFSVENTHCHICLSSVMDDDDFITDEELTINSSYVASIVESHYLSWSSSSISFYCSRAPPSTL